MFDPDTNVKAKAAAAALVRDGGSFEVAVTPPAGGFVAGSISLEFTNPKAGTDALPKIEGTFTVK